MRDDLLDLVMTGLWRLAIILAMLVVLRKLDKILALLEGVQ